MDTIPLPKERGAVRMHKSARYGRKLSKLAEATPAVVRSVEQHTLICQRAAKAIPAIVAKRQNASGSTPQAKQKAQHGLTLALRALCQPLYMVALSEDYTVFVSANVLSDYRREGIAFTILAMPVFQRFGRIASVRKSDVDMAYVEQFHASRANDHAMGMAQEAWRIAHQEGDASAERAAYHWLYHGTLRPCKDPDCTCSLCDTKTKRRMQATELTHLAFRYLSEGGNERSYNDGDRSAHRMRQPTETELSLAFGGNFKRAD